MLLGTEFLACFVNLNILESSHLQTHAFQLFSICMHLPGTFCDQAPKFSSLLISPIDEMWLHIDTNGIILLQHTTGTSK